MPLLEDKEELLLIRKQDSIASWFATRSPIKYPEEKTTFVKNLRDSTGKKKSPISLPRTSRAEEREEIEKIFDDLVKRWREETRGISSTNELAMHQAYQQIIGMGEKVVPLLLRELEHKTGRWFWALKSITREDPVPPEKRGKTKDMIEIWLNWGREKGYKW